MDPSAVHANDPSVSEGASANSAKLDALYEGFKAKFPEVPEVTVGELRDWLLQSYEDMPSPVLIDVRTDAEQQVSMIPGPLTFVHRKLEERAGQEALRGRRIVCYCTAGYRSGLYAQKLRREYGLDAYNLRGSILAWTQAGLPLRDPRDGSHTTRVHVFSKDWALQGPGYTPIVFNRPLLWLLLDALVGWWRSVGGGSPLRRVTGWGKAGTVSPTEMEVEDKNKGRNENEQMDIKEA